MTRLIVVDTSYLLEFFALTSPPEDATVTIIRKRFETAVEEKASFFVPFSCLVEVANFVARSPQRQQIGQKFESSIQSSLRGSVPWTIPVDETIDLPEMFSEWYRDHLIEGRSLTDYTVARHAALLKKRYRGLGTYLVHIWTKEKSLKAREPDKEPNPFLG